MVGRLAVSAGYLSTAFGPVFPARYRRRMIVMLRAYLDASVSQVGPRIICLAGYLAPLDRWERFDRRWRRILKQLNLKYFHMTDFMSGKAAPFRYWSREKRARVFKRFSDAITDNVMAATVTVLYRDEFDAIPAETRATYFRSEYALCVAGCFGGTAAELIRANINESVAYIFELGDEGSGRCIDGINHLLASRLDYGGRYRVLSAHLENKRNAIGLQAADVLAYIVRRAAQERRLPDDPQLLALVQAKPTAYRELSGENLRGLAQDVTAEYTDEKKAEFARMFVRPRRQRRRRGSSQEPES